ncbi:MAG: hypothetical protein AB1815_03450 [Bacillota bacterium]
MDTVCKLCNNMAEVKLNCNCGGAFQNSGPVTDYYGPYSPYYNVHFEANCCCHLFTCPRCGRDQVVAIALESPARTGEPAFICLGGTD